MLRGFCFAVLLLVAGTAQAHVVIAPDQAPADSYARVKFVIGHGCSGSATVVVRVRLPDDVLFARPQAKPGWTIEVKRAALPTPAAALHGRPVVDRVVEIEWRGGRLDDAQFDEFGLSLRLPERAGGTLWFPVTQICEQGSLEWSQIPAAGQKWGDLPTPAPFIKVLPAQPPQ